MAVLSQAVGYVIVIGFGVFFSGGMILLSLFERKFLGQVETSESFSTANRALKSGIIASSIVSAWTWAATLLQSSSVAYNYGVSGPFWYASGATIQVLLFAILAIEVKKKAPNCHTFLEIIYLRYGRTTHLVFLAFALTTNMIVTAMLLLGGSSVVSTLTGMSVEAACFLIPVGVIAYVTFGGLKATFITDYIHTAILFIIILFFGFVVYVTSPLIGSPGTMYDLLSAASIANPIDQNQGGSFLTMSSTQGLIFGIINIVGNFGTVFVDQAYFQRAIAASPKSALPGYLIGGLCWFAIPFFLATTLGLACAALESNPAFPYYPLRIPAADVSAGLAAPTAATALLGSNGALAILILVFMAVTSASSGELIAVSSICTYDIYRTYFKPNATGKDLIKFSHIAVVSFGCFMGVLAIILKAIGISLGYLYLLMGVLVAPAVMPIALTLTWPKQNARAAVAGAVGGLVCGLTAWLVTARAYYGYINLDSTGGNYPMLAGNLASLICSSVITIVFSLLQPDNYDWAETMAMEPVKEGDMDDAAVAMETAVTVVTDQKAPEMTDEVILTKASTIAYWASIVMTVILIIVWPIPMHLSNYVFSKSFFTGWVALGFTWASVAAVTVIFLPLIETRHVLFNLLKKDSKEFISAQ
ncbi:urea active transporter [Chytriomyces sp. MP71]|nr:urea active transporter [Chytriomyces sp. MP71]